VPSDRQLADSLDEVIGWVDSGVLDESLEALYLRQGPTGPAHRAACLKEAAQLVHTLIRCAVVPRLVDPADLAGLDLLLGCLRAAPPGRVWPQHPDPLLRLAREAPL
jgi:hypothetical protein